MTELEMTGCQCGCTDAMTPPASRDEELATLREQKALIEQRLEELHKQRQ